MKKHIFYKQKQLKSQKSLDYYTNNTINFIENKYFNNISLINKEYNNDKYEKIIILLEEENKKMKMTNNKLTFEIEKKNIYFNKIYKLLKYIFNYYKINNNKEILDYIKNQQLEILFDKNDKNNYNIILSQILFETNQYQTLNDLENYKNKYNDIMQQLNYITNIKYNNNNKDDSNNNKILEYQKEMNKLYSSNEKLINENAYLKLICQNIFLEKNNLDINEKNINIGLKKENEILQKDKERLLKIITQIKTNSSDNKDINEHSFLCNELNNDYDLLYNEIEKLKYKNKLLLNELNILKNKKKIYINNFNNLVIEQINSYFLDKNIFKEIDVIKEQNINIKNVINNESLINNNIECSNNDNNNNNIEDVNILLLLYNKSKQLEQFLNNSKTCE